MTVAYTSIAKPTGEGVRDDMIRRERDDAFIPADPLNTDWQAYQAWLAAGNAPAEPAAGPTTKPA